ncbi:MAG TPA: ABC transporter ATP-binding protein [Planctomycetota bacterium]|nr:ABC transporter ATP-binding protein [Planctomycetota bacterium]
MNVRAESIRKEYPSAAGPVVALDRVSLDLDAGRALAVTGPSGCGKSTLLHILGTLEQPSSGTLRLGDIDPSSLDDRALSRFRNDHIGFVFQDHYLLPQCSVLENVLVPTLVSKEPNDESLERGRDLLAKLGLEHRLDHHPAQLSGGERQRAAIARALIRKPGLLLCDEPTGNLDEANAARVAELLLELWRAEGCTLIVVTHSEELARLLPERLRLRAGAREA